MLRPVAGTVPTAGNTPEVAADAELAPEPPAEEEKAAPSKSPRGILYRRGSKHGAKSAQIPLVGVVDLDEGEAAEKKPKARRAPRGGAKRGGRGRKKGGAAGE